MLKLKLQYFGHLRQRTDSFRKDPDAGKDWGQEEKGAAEDEMVGWHHWLNGHEFEQTLGNSEGQASLGCCSPWGHEELDTAEWLNNNNEAKENPLHPWPPPYGWPSQGCRLPQDLGPGHYSYRSAHVPAGTGWMERSKQEAQTLSAFLFHFLLGQEFQCWNSIIIIK